MVLAQSVPGNSAASAPTAAFVGAGMPSFADVAERVSPAVVNVTVISEASPRMLFKGHPELKEGAPMDEFFRRFFDNPESQGQGPRRSMGAGSGFVVDPQGYIVTNNHVVDGASEVTVTFNDGAKLEAKVLGRDPKTDLALLKVDAAQPLAHVDLGDSASARVGDWVLAVGNPFGLGGTVSAGIISARGRDINSGPYDDYIQIDAPINRGNSGGPLFDAYGRVIGVNTAIYSPTGGNVGIGFAIPAETVRSIVADLQSKGRVDRGWLGVQIQPVTDEIAAGLGLEGTKGVLVADILPDGPAAGSDLKAGDVIVRAGGQVMEDYKDLPKLIAATEAGTTMRLDIVRDGKPATVSITIGSMPEDETLAKNDASPAANEGERRLGLYLAPLTPEIRSQNGIADGAEGVFVAKVQSNSPAERAGIEVGSVISMVGAEPVSTPDQVVQAVRRALEENRDALVLRVEKDGRPLFVAVKLES
jgi:serine protease Do